MTPPRAPFPAPEPGEAETGPGASPGTALPARVFGAIGWSWSATVAKAVLTLVVLTVLSRLLTPRDFGLFAMIWIVLDLATRFGQVGIGHALIRQEALTDRHLESGHALSLALGGVMAAAIWLAAPLFARLVDEPGVTRPLQALAPVFVIAGAGVVSGHLLRRDLRFKPLMVADLLAYSSGYGLVATVLAYRGFGVWALVWGEVVRVLIHTAAVLLYSPPRVRPRFGAREAAELLSRGAGLSVIQGFDFIVRTGGHFVVGRWLGVASLGHYTRAERLASLPLQYVGASVFEVAFPALARRRRQSDRVRAAHLQGMELLSLAMLPLCVLTFMSAPEIVAVVLGGQWDAAVTVLRILAVAIPFQTCGLLNVVVVRVFGAASSETWRQGVHAGLVGLGAWFGSGWGLTGVAIAVLGAQVGAHLLMAQAASSLLGLGGRRLLQSYLPALWTGAWAALVLWPVAGWLRAKGLPDGLTLAAEVSIWGAAAAAATYAAPSFARPTSVHRVLAYLPLDALGTAGRLLGRVLQRLPAPRDPG